jgi:hypothetical protein
MNNYLRTHVEYTAILHALETISRPVWERYGKQNSSSAAWAVADYKTIGFTVGRQCGATHGIHKWLNEHKGKCLLISADATLRKESLRKYLETFDSSDMTDYYRAVPCIDAGVKYHFDDNGTPEATADMIENVRYVILDDSVYHYTFGRSGGRAAFNQWVADTFHEDTFVILIK